MELQPDAAYFPFTGLNSQHPVSFQYPAEDTALAPATDPWIEMTFNRCDWTTGLPADPRLGPTTPYFAETPQITQVPQPPTPYILPAPLWSYPGSQSASPPEFECWVRKTVNPGGDTHAGVGASLDFAQDDRVEASVCRVILVLSLIHSF